MGGSEEEEKRKYDESKKMAELARQSLVDKGQKMIAEMGIKIDASMPAPINPGTVNVRLVPIQTNLFGIRINEQNSVYKYDISIHCEMGKKMVEFTKKGNVDYIVSERKKKCVLVFSKAIEESFVYRDDLAFFYDGQSIMYTVEKLAFEGNKMYDTIIYPEGSVFGKDFEAFKNITFSVKPCTEGFMFQLDDIRKVDNLADNESTKDRSAMQFAEVVSSMHALFDDQDRFTVFAHGKIFPNNPVQEGLKTTPLREGKVIVPGVTKAVKLVEGPRGRSNASPAIAIESLKAAFHEKQKLIDKAITCLGNNINNPAPFELDQFAQQVRGLGCMTNHQEKPRRLEITGISRDNASRKIEVAFDHGGATRTVTVEEYFKLRYNRVLKYPGAPLAMSRERGQMNLYPMECLDILSMQRVTISQTTGAQSQICTKACAVGPAARQREIMEQCRVHDFFNPAQKYMKAAGLGIISRPLEVEGRLLPAPTLDFHSNSITVDPNIGSWKPPQNFQFAVPGECPSWAIYAVLGPRDNFFTLQHLTAFALALMKRCGERGLRIPKPEEGLILSQHPADKGYDFLAREKIKECAYHNVRFVMFIMSDQLPVHKYVKLEERYQSVITQTVKVRTVLNYLEKQQHLTMDNICYKTNLKLGGLNYGVNMLKAFPQPSCFPPTRLVMGIGMSSTPSASFASQKLPPPTSVGWSANCARYPTEFIGDFILQDGGKTDLLATLAPLMETVLDRFVGKVDVEGSATQAATRDPPSDLIVYRQGVTDGQFAQCMEEEIPLVKAALAKYGARDCRVTYVIVQKDHSIRLMPPNINVNDRPTLQNIGSGIVVDSQITHPNYKEFYLNSHLTLQGSARTPRYIVLYDDAKMAMVQLEVVTNALCFNFQIVNSPISIPSPLYIANRYAERGTMMQSARMSDELATTDQKLRNSLSCWNEDLPYSHTPLGARRINA